MIFVLLFYGFSLDPTPEIFLWHRSNATTKWRLCRLGVKARSSLHCLPITINMCSTLHIVSIRFDSLECCFSINNNFLPVSSSTEEYVMTTPPNIRLMIFLTVNGMHQYYLLKKKIYKQHFYEVACFQFKTVY